MNLFTLVAKIGLDTDEYEKNVKESSSKAKQLRGDVTKLTSSFTANQNKIKVLSAQYETAKGKVDKLRQAFNESVRTTGATSEKTKKLAQELNKAEKESGELKVEIDRLKRASKGAGDQFAEFGQKVHRGLDTIKRASIALVGAGATLFAGLAKMGVDYNAQMENYTTNFKVMLGSTEAATAKVEELKKMAAATPFGMSDLAEATQTLLAFQVPADETTDILRMLGDVSLGNKEKLKGLALVFGQVSSAGKLQGQDLMQMINQGFNPLNYISQRTGESMEELRQRMSEGGVSAEEVKQAFIDATSAGGQFYNGMEEASKTTQGLVSTLKDVVNSKLGEFFEKISEKIKEVLPDVIEFVENIDVEKVTEKLETLVKVFKWMVPVIAGATAAVGAYKTAMAISGVISAVKKATEGATTAQQLFNAVLGANPAVKITALIIGLVTALTTLWLTNEDFRNAIQPIWDAIKAVFIGAWEAIKTTWDAVAPFFQLLWDTIKNIFSVVKSVLSGDFQAAWEAIKNIFSGWSSFFSNLWETVKNAFSGVFDFFSNIGQNVVEGIKSGISWAWDNLVGWFNNLWSSLFGGRSVNVDVNTRGFGGGRGHAGGLSYVPYNEYPAKLHRGEAVLTEREANEWRKGKKSGGGVVFSGLSINISGAKYENERSLAAAIAEQLQEMAERKEAVYA